jgi:hypothetical protein
MVPGGGFEPPTRGFSIRCSTPELPGHRDMTHMRWKGYRKFRMLCPALFQKKSSKKDA